MEAKENFNLKDFNSYKVSSICKLAYFPNSEAELVAIYQKHKDDKIVLLGNGNNVLLAAEFYDCIFIIFSGNFNQIKIKGKIIEAQAGATMLDMSLMALDNCLTGIEVFYDIPSSLGGAIVMNAGASGEEIKAVVSKVKYYNIEENEISILLRDEIGFEYRNSFFQNNLNLVVLSAEIELEYGNRDSIQEKMDKTKEGRWAKQPRDYPSAGSVFKRPSGKFVGPMLDELGLKGFAIGGAMVSEKHSGFIINHNNATGKDIIDLIEEIRRRVHLKYDILLEVEQRII